MRDLITVKIDGAECRVAPGTSVASAVLNRYGPVFRRSVSGEPRGPLCGMGTCFECRVTIDGAAHERSCNVLCGAGMDIGTSEPGAGE